MKKGLATTSYDQKLKKLLNKARTEKELYKAIVNVPFGDKKHVTELDLGIAVLLLVNKKTGMIDRVALSDTDAAKGAMNMSIKRFEEIKIPLDFTENIIAKAIKSGTPQQTFDWRDLFIPALTPEDARFNQAGAGITCSFVYPLIGVKDGGALIFSYYQQHHITDKPQVDFMENYRRLVTEKLQKI